LLHFLSTIVDVNDNYIIITAIDATKVRTVQCSEI